MGRKSISGEVIAKGINRIQYDFRVDGVRYRPSVLTTPTESNLRRARENLAAIKQRIVAKTFNFVDEFPDFRDLGKISHACALRTCNQVFDDFLGHCGARAAKYDLAASTLTSYRKILDSVWRPVLGARIFLQTRYSDLVKVADGHRDWSKKSYNNAVSVLRRAFAFGYRDHPYRSNPACSLRCARITRRDRPRVNPFRIQDAERLIEAIHHDWGEAQGNYDEFRLFTGLRPSEEIALTVNDVDLTQGLLSITKARVLGVRRDRTKTDEDRVVRLSPRALSVLKRQLALRERLRRTGRLRHDALFCTEDGDPIPDLLESGRRWRKSLERLGLSHRRPYCARHSSVSWNLMAGKNPLFVARQHGHSVETMWRVYAAWMDGAVESDVAAIERAFNRPSLVVLERQVPTESGAPPFQAARSRLTTRPVGFELGCQSRLATGLATLKTWWNTKLLNLEEN